ncbi:MAG TPA: hypothetical protein VIW07_13370 [Candidatus Udaeobacter sp.]
MTSTVRLRATHGPRPPSLILFSLDVVSIATVKTLLTFLVIGSLCGCVVPFPTTLHARGYVRDAATKKPIARARVTVQGHPNATAITIQDGSFDIPAETKLTFHPVVVPLEPTPHSTLSVTAAGYRARVVEASYEKRDIFLVRE